MAAKRLGGETTRGGNGLGAKRPGFVGSFHFRSRRLWVQIKRPHQIKGVQNGTLSSLANACIKSACARLSRRLSKAGKYVFKILLCSRIASMLMLSVTL